MLCQIKIEFISQFQYRLNNITFTCFVQKIISKYKITDTDYRSFTNSFLTLFTSSTEQMNKQQDYNANRYKSKKRFRLSFVNENTFNEVWTVKITLVQVIIAVAAIIVAMWCIISTLIVATPIKTLLPGYLKGSQRQEYVINNMRIDSLFTKVSITNSYISNLTDILTDDIDTTTIIPADTVRQIIPVDSIIGTSDREKQFVRQFEAREKFNLSVLSPIIAEGMTFIPPVNNAAVSDNNTNNTCITLITPHTAPISSIYEGTVIDCYYLSASGNTVTIQHPNGFISKVTGISEPFVGKGDKVKGGDRIGLVINNRKKHSLTFELWRNGTPLNPLDYIAF